MLVALGETPAVTLFAGRPYFVMELVQGVPITEFCAQNQLSAEKRIQLFIPVCQAIQSAHQKGIIHRDIKPSNVLVTLHDGVPVPKVIDFGVAKAINQKLTEKTLFTTYATMIGTPAYMSPEQAEMSGLDIDTRSDIYGLGVLLYELLTGTTPFPEQRLRSVAYREMQRIILEEEPERPSTRLTRTLAASATTRRDSELKIETSESQIDPDLDWIVMKCLEKDRQRRYETASGLAADMQRFLGSEPIVARPPSAAYRFQKLVRRHRAASMAVALVTIALFLGVSVATWALHRERAARLREQIALEQANLHVGAANDFVKQVFGKVAPGISKLAGAADAQETLTQAGLTFVRRLRAIARDDPASRAALAQMLIQSAWAQNPGVANSVGDYAKGLKQADEAFELLRAGSPSLTPSEHALWLYHSREATVRCLWALGRREEGLARVPELEAMLEQMEKQSSAAQWARERRIGLRLSTGAVLVDTGRFKEAIEGYFQPFLASKWTKSIGDDPPEFQLTWLICANDNLTSAYAFLNEFDAMLPFANEAVRLAELLVKKFPLDARFAAGRPYSWSMQGYAWLRTGRVNEGLAVLAKARQEIERLISTDAANDLFRYMRAIVAANQALAFAGWSQEKTTVEEREKRLSQAQTHLVEAEEFDRAAKARDQETYLKAARAEVSVARAKIQADKNAQSKP